MSKRIGTIASLLGALACFAGYTYYCDDPLTTLESYWTRNGTVSAGSGGLTSGTYGSLIYASAAPSDYEVKTALTIGSGGGDVRSLSAGDQQFATGRVVGTGFSLCIRVRGGFRRRLVLGNLDAL